MEDNNEKWNRTIEAFLINEFGYSSFKTYDEMIDLFKSDQTLAEDFKAEILSRLDGFITAMVNCVNHRKQTMKMINVNGDTWCESHNDFVTIYQRYYAALPD